MVTPSPFVATMNNIHTLPQLAFRDFCNTDSARVGTEYQKRERADVHQELDISTPVPRQSPLADDAIECPFNGSSRLVQQYMGMDQPAMTASDTKPG